MELLPVTKPRVPPIAEKRASISQFQAPRTSLITPAQSQIRSRSTSPNPSAPTTAALPSSTTNSHTQNISIQPLTPTTLPSFRRTISLLLPIRYPDKFFNEILSSPSVSALSRVAIWYDRPRPGKRKRQDETPTSNEALNSQTELQEAEEGRAVGGIRCRLEPIPCAPSAIPPTQQQLYIQTIALLSPYRGRGIATQLLNEVIRGVLHEHDNVTSIYAHVWEANTEGLEWYVKRGFVIEDGVLEGYYRRLKPGGAKVARRAIGVADYLRTKATA